MKRRISLLIIISILSSILVSAFSFMSLADEGETLIQLVEEPNAETGEIKVTAILYDNPGIAGYRLDLEFNPEMFYITNYEANEYFYENGLLLDNTSEDDTLRFTWSDTKNYTENGELFTVYFSAVDAIPDTYSFELVYDEHNIANAELEYVPLTVQNIYHVPANAPAPTIDPLNVDIANPFTDVPEDAWFKKYVMYCLAHELFFGVSPTEFEPQMKMTRAMFITVLYRLAGNGEKAADTSAFDDVPADSWYGPSVYWANSKGLVSGLSPRKFAPEDLITREQMMVIIYNFYKGTPTDYNLTFSDASMISSWAKDAVRFCVSKEIISGREDNTLAPTEGLTRAEASKMFFTVATTLNNTEEPAPEGEAAPEGETAPEDESASED